MSLYLYLITYPPGRIHCILGLKKAFLILAAFLYDPLLGRRTAITLLFTTYWLRHIRYLYQSSGLPTSNRGKRKATNDVSSPPSLSKRLKSSALRTNTGIDVDANYIPILQVYDPWRREADGMRQHRLLRCMLLLLQRGL